MIKIKLFPFYLFIFIIIQCMVQSVYAQNSNANSQEITVLKKNSGMTLIEIIQGHDIVEYKNKISKYWMTGSSNDDLQQSLLKAEKWSNLNKIHHKEFRKELTRFQVVPKTAYGYHGFSNYSSVEAVLLFNGHNDGTFNLNLNVSQNSSPDNYETRADLNLNSNFFISKFIRLLQGKAAGGEIDNIFN